MEVNNIPQQPASEQLPVEKQSFFRNLITQKGNLVIIIVLIFVILVLGIGVYILGTQRNKTTNTSVGDQSQSNSTQTTTTTNLTQAPTNPNVNKMKSVEDVTYIKDGDIYVYDLKTKRVNRLTNYGFNSWAILSPDNSKIAYLSIPEAVTKTDKVSKGNGSFYRPYSYGDYQDVRNVWIIDADGTNAIQVTNDIKKRGSITWSADSSKIVYEETGALVEYSLNNKSKVTIVASGTSPVYSSVNSYLGYLTNDSRTIVLKLSTGEKKINRSNRVNGLNWSQSEDKIFYTSLNQKDQQGTSSLGVKFSIWAYSISNDKEKQITDDSLNISSPTISSDETYIIAQRGSGYADAGNIDLSSLVLKVNNDLNLSQQIKLENFKGSSFFEKEKQYMFPTGEAVWVNNKEYLIFLGELLNPQPNPRGLYKLNVETLTAERLLELQ